MNCDTHALNLGTPEKHKQVYIEYVRAFATIAVVLLHIVMTLPANYTIDELGVFPSAVFNSGYMLTKWAVPCFVMISGSLLLDSNKCIDLGKIGRYIRRMCVVLLTFGTCFALMEMIFNERSFRVGMILKALLNVLEEKSWSHLWYIYVLIALYIITIPLKRAVQYLSPNEFDWFIGALVVGSFIIPTINVIANLKIRNFMIISEYATYYLLGHWLTIRVKRFGRSIILFGLLATLMMVWLEIHSIINSHSVFEMNHGSNDILTLIQSVSILLFARAACENRSYGKVIRTLCDYSFGIYIIHPLWINLIYKGLKITPLSMPIGVGIVVIFSIVFILSWGTTLVLKKLPFFKSII